MYTSKQIVHKLDISLRQLYYWELKGVVTPELISLGTREFKRYSETDLIKLRLIKKNIDLGYTLTAAIKKLGEK